MDRSDLHPHLVEHASADAYFRKPMDSDFDFVAVGPAAVTVWINRQNLRRDAELGRRFHLQYAHIRAPVDQRGQSNT